MITRIELKNLRSFRGPHAIDLGPITLIYGPNSAGKSTIIQALGLLKQTLAGADSGRPPALVLRGSEVDFGNFKTAVFEHEDDSELAVGVEVSDQRSIGGSFGVGLGFTKDGPSHTVVGSGGHRLRFAPDRDRYLLNAETNKQALTQILARYIADVDSAGGDIRDYEVVRDRVQGRLDECDEVRFLGKGFFPATPERGFIENPYTDTAFGAWFTQHLFHRASLLGGRLADLVYLGPVRRPPTRFQEFTSDYAGSVGKTGEHTARLLGADVDDGKLIAKVNTWFEYLEVPYRVGVRDLDLPAGDVVTTLLTDTRNPKVAVTPQDVGYGVSQLLPVVVQMLVADGATVCVEQPEVHIHPRLQARLADLLIAAAEQGTQVIVETHSEALMLRLQGRLRERKIDWLEPDNVSVYYVDVEADGTSVPLRRRLRRDGTFKDAWPDGFFAERLHEVASVAFPTFPDTETS